METQRMIQTNRPRKTSEGVAVLPTVQEINLPSENPSYVWVY
jgi:hypothetical protein